MFGKTFLNERLKVAFLSRVRIKNNPDWTLIDHSACFEWLEIRQEDFSNFIVGDGLPVNTLQIVVGRLRFQCHRVEIGHVKERSQLLFLFVEVFARYLLFT